MKSKRLYLLVFVLCLALLSASAEGVLEAYQPVDYNNYDLCVGSTTEMSGYFFTDLWGNNAADMDVRLLLHGYNLVYWDNEIGGYQVDPNVVSGLIVMDDENGNRRYVLAINHELCYSDGTQITAKDYVFSMLLQMSPQVRALGGESSKTDLIVGMDQFKSGASKRVSGIQLIDDYHFSVTVRAEFYPNFYELSLLSCYPYPISVIAPGCEVTSSEGGAAIENIDKSLKTDLFTPELLQKTIFDGENGYMSHPSVVSGPYTLVSFDGRSARFEINRNYKGNAQAVMPMIPRLTMTLAENETMVEKLAAGEFGLLNRCLNPETVKKGVELIGTGDYSAAGYARNGLCTVHFCCEQPAVSSQAVRQAIAMCMDKDELIAQTVGEVGKRVDGFYGLGQWMYILVNGVEDVSLNGLTIDIGDTGMKTVEKDPAVWGDMNLDGLKVYNLDVDAANALLDGDGWTLNTAGNAYDPEKDAVRCKRIDGQLTPLALTLVYPEGNVAGKTLEGSFAENLSSVGIALTLEAKPMPELLKLLYRQEKRDCDMIYVAMNLTTLFDPSSLFSTEPEAQGVLNCTGIMDEELYQAALSMSKVQPGDLAEYCKRWIAFEERWTEVLPAIPIYSNVYVDFYTAHLQDYAIAEDISWAEAIVPSYMADPQP